MKFKYLLKLVCLGIGLMAFVPSVNASVINGGFESGLNGWRLFTTANGTLGDQPLPQVGTYDVVGNSAGSNSLKLSVGYAVAPCSFPGIFCPKPTEGGGIQQSIYLSSGLYSFHVDVAVENTPLYGGSNMDGGTFSMILDGLVLDTVSFGQIISNSVERDQLNFETSIGEGVHDLQILVTRNYAQSDSLFQFVDNITITPVPEPTTLGLLAIGCLTMLLARPKKKAF